MGHDNLGASDCWDGVLSDRINHIGIAPFPEQYSSAITSSMEALLEKEKALQDTMDSLQSRSYDEERALLFILEGLREHQRRQESIIYSSISTIRQYRNLFSPVARLPPEILSRIFVLNSQMAEPEDWIEAVKSNSQVCKRWREIALDCRELWSQLDFNRYSPRWLERIVERSQPAPLSFIGGDQVGDWPGDGRMALAISNIHRFKSIELWFPWDYEGNIHPLFKMFSQPAPMLRHLTMYLNYGDPNFALPPEFLGGYAPNLRHIKLVTHFDVPWHSPLFANLTTLVIVGRKPQGPRSSSLEMLLDALAKMPRLEFLILNRCIPPPTHSMMRCAHVDLPNLKRLELSDHLRHCTGFLGQITINPTATLHLTLNCYDTEWDMYLRFLEVFQSHPWTTPTPTEVLDFTWKNANFRIDAWPVRQGSEDLNSVDANTKISVMFVPDDVWALGMVQACFPPFVSPQLHSFSVSSNAMECNVNWGNLARMAPHLRRLAVGGGTYTAELCMALRPPDGLDLPADCFLPELLYLEFTDRYKHTILAPDGGETQLSTFLAQILAARAMIGCLTPEVVFIVPPSEESPEGWSDVLLEAVPGIVVREKHG
ncbi:hypothetical protein BD779DRAFT_1479304 [Infundibulicybe gibba]|nr:hypothetical protein BD779DRAFT_1479304 [Infundibulicybe gibba]